MSDNIPPTAVDLRSPNFLTIGEDNTLRNVMSILMDRNATVGGEHTFVVSDDNNAYSGILSQRRLLTTLFDNPGRGASDVKPVLLERLERKVSEVMERDRPVLEPSTPLLEIIRLMVEPEFECLPILENGKVDGVVYIADVFRTASGLALTPETSGIRVEKH